MIALLTMALANGVAGPMETNVGDMATIIAQVSSQLRDEPGNANLAAGLRLAREYVAAQVPARDRAALAPEWRWFPDVLFSPIANAAAFLAWCVLWLTVAQAIVHQSRKWGVAACFLAPAALIPLMGVGVISDRHEADRATPSVVVQSDCELREGNGDAYPTKMRLTPGLECRLIVQRNEWRQVRFSSGLTGWIPAKAALVMEP